MKALSVMMPWPYLIMMHGKDVENRTWSTNYRGRILIHASKKHDPFLTYIVQRCLPDMTADEIKKYFTWCGHIVGSVELIDCVQNHPSKWAEPNMWHWVLRKPEIFRKMIPVRGSMGLWEYKE